MYSGIGAITSVLAAINSIGNLAGFAGPFAMGYLKDMTGDFTIGMLALATLSAIGALAVLMLRIDPKMEKAQRRRAGAGALVVRF
jgi:ACS family tartrate transporter-like MFS transporter